MYVFRKDLCKRPFHLKLVTYPEQKSYGYFQFNELLLQFLDLDIYQIIFLSISDIMVQCIFLVYSDPKVKGILVTNIFQKLVLNSSTWNRASIEYVDIMSV